MKSYFSLIYIRCLEQRKGKGLVYVLCNIFSFLRDEKINIKCKFSDGNEKRDSVYMYIVGCSIIGM